jgi:amino acid transporter
MYVRGGVYVVVRDAMGPFLARLSVSAIIFDYILTGPISAVSAGHYLGRLINEISELVNAEVVVTPGAFAAVFALVVTIYFWRSNIKGIHESSAKALRIMQITTVMVVIFLVWCTVTLLAHGPAQIPPPPTPSNLEFGEHDLGWLSGLSWVQIPAVAIIVAFGHSVLAMSGFETLAQVYREIASPKLKNLKITANIVCGYAVVATGVITLFAAMIIPDSMRLEYVDNLLGGLAMHLAGTSDAAACLPCVRRDGRCPHPFRCREYIHHRRQRRPQPPCRRRSADAVVPASPQEVRHRHTGSSMRL